MELEQLRIFAAVAECGSFSGAAKKLFISHSTTSRAVSALEEELKLRFFLRGNRIDSITPAGEALLKEVREVLLLVDTLQDRVAETIKNQNVRE